MEEKKLTDEEIVKAFENCCVNDCGCAECPYATWYIGNSGGCDGDIEAYVLDLIHRLQAQNAEYERKLTDGELVSKEWHDEQVGHAELVIEEQKAEIERLTREVDKQKNFVTAWEESWKIADEQNTKMRVKLKKENAELQKQVDELKDERENMQAEILRFEDMKFTQEHCDLYDENEALKQWLKRLNVDLENEKNWGKIQAKQAEKDTAEKFAERLKEAIINMKWARDDTHIKLVTQGDCLKAIDEICKEITEGKDNASKTKF
jgi:hypothetical protein